MEILFSTKAVPYPEAMAFMEERVAGVASGSERELVWFLEHPPVFTAGTSADDAELLEANSIPVYKTGRGGRFTHHAPGQRVVYFILNLRGRAGGGVPDVRKFVWSLEEVVISALAELGVEAHREAGKIGIWVLHGGLKQKIAALGVRFSRGVSMHGFALNVSNDLSLFGGIIPCGIREFGVCSLASLGVQTSMQEVDNALLRQIKAIF